MWDMLLSHRAADCALAALVALAALHSASASPCAVALDAPLSLRWAPSAGNATATFLRHAGYVAWVTPVESAMDDLDSTFVPRRALSGDAGAVSFENADEFAGYFLSVEVASNNSIKLVSAPEPRSASFFLRDGDGGVGCSFESVLLPGSFASVLSPIQPQSPSPCHYDVCPPVAAVAAPAPAPVSTFLAAPPNNAPPPADNYTSFTAGGLYFEVRGASGTIAVLRDASDAGSANFSFTPDEKDGARAADGSHRFGDVTIRARTYGSSSAFAQASTTVAKAVGPVAPKVAPQLPGRALWAADLTPLLNSTPVFATAVPGLRVARELTATADGLGVVMSFVLSNSGSSAIEVGGFDVSLVTDNNWQGLTLEQNAERCSLSDPYLGADGGFLRVMRISGTGPVLLVAPASAFACGAALPGTVACGGRFENWRMLRDDPARRGVTFEGFYAWAFTTKAWADNEWVNAQQFNDPTTLVLRPGERAVYSLRLATSPFAAVDETLVAMGMPLARASPGTVLTADMAKAHLLVRPPPGGYALSGADVDPPFALAVAAAEPSPGGDFLSLPVSVASGATGRARITLRFAVPGALPPLLQTVHYLLLPPLSTLTQRLGAFASERAWLNDTTDAFGRAFSFGHWDASVNAVTLQESHAWVAGLSDESGAAMVLAAATLASSRPDDDGAAVAAAQLATYVNRTLLGSKANSAGEQTSIAQADGGIRASMFFSGLKNYPYTVQPCWDEPRSLTLWRAYNYIHQTMVQLQLYRIARDAPCTVARAQTVAAASSGSLDALQPWASYLRGAAATHAAMWAHSGPTANYFLSQ